MIPVRLGLLFVRYVVPTCATVLATSYTASKVVKMWQPIISSVKGSKDEKESK